MYIHTHADTNTCCSHRQASPATSMIESKIGRSMPATEVSA